MERTLNILHLEDNLIDAELIASWLEEGGLDCEIVRVDTREDFVTVLRECSFDLIFADRTTPTFDGISALALAKELQPGTPFIFISGTLDEEMAITTLRNGATDYVLKHRLSRLLPAVERAITELKQRKELDRAAQALKEQAELLDRANDMIMIRDLQGRITYWNSGAERLYGWTKEEARGEVLHTLLRTKFFKPEDDVQARLLQTGHWEGELEHEKKDGSRVLVESRWTLRRDPQGTPTSILEINSDLTERRRLQEQLLQAQKLESLGTLAGGIAHDFNNILSIVLGYASLLETVEPRSAEIDEISATMIQAGERGASLVRQLLTFARKNPTVFAPLVVNDLVEDVVKMLQQTFPKNITFVRELEPALNPIVADASQIHQVLLNLCVNARDAMPEGGTLRVETATVNGSELLARYPTAGDVDYVQLRVSDSGVGMDGETQHRLYEPFFTTKEVGKGTGLGLAVVYGAVQSHRGFIHLESALGKGTTFSLYFPVADSAVVASDVTSTSAGPRGNGELILVVEDEKMLRELLQGLLQNHGYRVLLARDGMEGLSTFEREASKIDLVLSDMGMPKLGGLEMYLRMKESGHSPKLLLCSGFLEPAVKLQLLEAGVTDFLLKPARPAQILRRVHEILQSKGSRGSEACLP